MAKRKRQPIEPKPTQYGNTLFRSRLEARWAVFLDFCGNVLNWEYEPQTFKLSNGWEYTPDFHVKFGNHKSLWLEVKPAMISPEYSTVLQRFSKQHNLILFLVQGDFYEGIFWTKTYYPRLGQPQADYLHARFDEVIRAATIARNFRFDLEQT